MNAFTEPVIVHYEIALCMKDTCRAIRIGPKEGIYLLKQPSHQQSACDALNAIQVGSSLGFLTKLICVFAL